MTAVVSSQKVWAKPVPACRDGAVRPRLDRILDETDVKPRLDLLCDRSGAKLSVLVHQLC